MAEPITGTWRHNLLFGLLVLGSIGLCVRLGWLVRLAPDMQAPKKALRQEEMVIPVPGRPGSIFARTRGSYVPLVVSRRVPSCYVDPSLLSDDQIGDMSIALGQALSMDPIRVQEQIVRRRSTHFIWLARFITDKQAEAVKLIRQPRMETKPDGTVVPVMEKKPDGKLAPAMEKVSAVGIVPEWQRDYPNEELASTVLGFRLRDGQPGGGLELGLDKELAATDGKQVMLADARRRVIAPLADQTRLPKDGSHVFLCLDVVVQDALQQAVNQAASDYRAKWVTGVVVDPMTGDVLAMASAPTFDPTRSAVVTPEERTNRAISLPYEPGSALKPVFAASAVDAGLVTYQTQIFCENGVYHALKGGQISDHGSHYGTLTVEDIVVFSSNIGMAKIGEKFGNAALFAVANRFGFGQPAHLDLPGESGGIIRPLAKWDGYSLRRVPFGQEISVTALQLTMAFAALTNGGLLLQPRLVDHVRGPEGQILWESHPKVVRRVLKQSVSEQTLAVLEQVVERGTGKACKMEKWTSFGKTGTAQIPGRGGYVDRAFTGSFVGGAPAHNPRAICLISVFWPDRTKGHFGAKVAAPYVKKVLETTLSYMKVPPDRPPPGGPTLPGTGMAAVTADPETLEEAIRDDPLE
jgi:cell division protein FtsI/penicillin-binding protein 2